MPNLAIILGPRTWAFCFMLGAYILFTPRGPVPINTIIGLVGIVAGIAGYRYANPPATR